SLEVLLRRLIGFAGVMIVLSLMIFILARVVPGDPARIALGPSATQAQVEAMRTEMGLDDPLVVQYVDYMTNALRGDFGRSLISGKPVMQELVELLPATLELVIVTVLIMVVVSVPLGVMTARYRNTWIDNTGRFFSIVGVTMPSFLVAILLQLIAANFIPGWPILGRIDHTLSVPAGPTGLLLVDSLAHGRGDVFFD